MVATVGTLLNVDVYVMPNKQIGTTAEIGSFARSLTSIIQMSNEVTGARDACIGFIAMDHGAWIRAGETAHHVICVRECRIVSECVGVTRDTQSNCLYAGAPTNLIDRLDPLGDS